MTNDHWDNAHAYDRFMGRWSRQLAPKFIDWMALPNGQAWLEIGCGTGALTSAICEKTHPRSVVALDTAPEFVDYCRKHLVYEPLQVSAGTIDSMPYRDGGYDVVVSSLVLNFLPDTVESLKKMKAACSTRGWITACVWDYSKGMEFLRRFWDAAVSVDPKAAAHDEGVRFPLCRPDALTAAFQKAGLYDIEIGSIVIPTVFHDFDDYWTSLSEGTGPAPSYLATLSESKRKALEARLRTSTRSQGKGPIELQARAWAIKSSIAIS